MGIILYVLLHADKNKYLNPISFCTVVLFLGHLVCGLFVFVQGYLIGK